MSVGERVRESRVAASLSQERLAQLANVAQSTIGNVEADPTRGLTAEVIFAVSDVLGVDARWLATGKGHALAERKANPEAEFVTLVLQFEDRAEAILNMQQIGLYSTLGGGRVVAVEAGKDIREICERHVEKALNDVVYLIQGFASMSQDQRRNFLVTLREIAEKHPRGKSHLSGKNTS